MVEKSPLLKDQDILVFTGSERPTNALDARGLVAHVVSISKGSLEKLKPKDTRSLVRSKEIMGEMMAGCLSVEPDPKAEATVRGKAHIKPKAILTRLTIGRKGMGEEIPGVLLRPTKRTGWGTLVVYQDGKSKLFEGRNPNPLASRLLSAGHDVLSIDCFLTGEYEAPIGSRREVTACQVDYYETYNRTDTALRIQDVLTSASFLRKACRGIDVVGFGDAGAWCLLASSVADGIESVAVDLNQFADDSEEHWMKLYVPGIMRAGGLKAAAAMNAPRRLLIHDAGGEFDGEWVESFYGALSAEDRLTISEEKLGHEAVLDWIMRKD